jgi:aquaporin Z
MANVNVLGNACNYAAGFAANGLTVGGIFAALIAEIVLTAIFVYVILNVTEENSGAGKKAGLIIGLTLTLVHLVGINVTGTSVNPARSLATAVSDLIYNGSWTSLSQVWMFIVAPLVGAVLAVVIFKCLHKDKKQEENK